MKLNLRDLFWLILVVAISVAWWIDRQAGQARETAALAKAAQAEKRIAEIESELNLLNKMLSVPPLVTGGLRGK